MSQEMKLLQALCEALGFEVERTLDYQEIKTYGTDHLGPDRRCETDSDGMYIIGEDEMYTSRLITPIVDFKLRAK